MRRIDGRAAAQHAIGCRQHRHNSIRSPSFLPGSVMRPFLAVLMAAAITGCGGSGSDGASVAKAAEKPARKVARPTEFRPPVPVGDWPQFLGPHGNGVADEKGLADTWPETGPPVVWTKEIGVGYSAPSVQGDRLVVHHRVGDEEVLECLDPATGKSRWKHSYPTNFRDPYGYNGGPRCTPLLAGGRCYTYGAAGTLCCVELATGKELWRREISKDFKIPDWFFGVGCSPVLYGDLLIALVGGQPDYGVVAFDAKTGDTVWHAVGKPTWDGAFMSAGGPKYEWTGDEMLVSYSSPLIASIGGEHHLLALMRQGLVSLDPTDGRERFHYWFRSGVHESVNAARPVVVGDEVLLTAAYRTGAALVKAKPDACEEVWRDRSNLECHWSTPIVADGYAYGFSGRHENEATLRCIELATGKFVWEADGAGPVADQVRQDPAGRGYVKKSDGTPAPWPFFGRGSMILADGKYILLGERGTLFLADLTKDGYHERARAAAPEISYPAWAAPVLSRGRLYLRDEDSVVCLDVSKEIEPKGDPESTVTPPAAR